MSKKERIMIFVDHNNIWREFRKLGIFYDYDKLKNIIQQNRNLVDMIIYKGVEPAKTPREKSSRKLFYERLRKYNIKIKTALIKISPDGKREEKEIDTSIAVDMIADAYEDKYDTAILVSGDRDYRPVVRKLLSINKNVEIWSFRKAISYKLSKEVHEKHIHIIDDYIDQIKLNRK